MNRYLKRIMILLVLVGIYQHLPIRDGWVIWLYVPLRLLRKSFTPQGFKRKIQILPEDFAVIHIREFAEAGNSGKSIWSL